LQLDFEVVKSLTAFLVGMNLYRDGCLGSQMFAAGQWTVSARQHIHLALMRIEVIA
jgi:hypothetical protein